MNVRTSVYWQQSIWQQEVNMLKSGAGFVLKCAISVPKNAKNIPMNIASGAQKFAEDVRKNAGKWWLNIYKYSCC